jgi:hypothetical protein
MHLTSSDIFQVNNFKGDWWFVVSIKNKIKSWVLPVGGFEVVFQLACMYIGLQCSPSAEGPRTLAIIRFLGTP